jgi:hypothetical protein
MAGFGTNSPLAATTASLGGNGTMLDQSDHADDHSALPVVGYDQSVTTLTPRRVRGLVRQVRSMVAAVRTSRDAATLVRRACATEKLVAEMLKACAVMEDEQFELRQAAAEAHLRTQRKAGELLIELAKHPGGRPSGGAPAGERPASLRELGIASHESHRWQRIGRLPEGVFEEYVRDCWEQRRELTIAGALALANRVAREGTDGAHPDVKRSDGRALLEEYQRCRPHLANMIWLEPGRLAAATSARQRREMLDELQRFRLWVAELMDALRPRDHRGGRT